MSNIERQALDERKRRLEKEQNKKEKEISTQERYLDKEKQQIKEERSKMKAIAESQKLAAQKRADEEASQKRKRIENLFRILMGIMLCTLVVFLSYGAYLSYANQGSILKRCAISLFIIMGLIGGVEIISDRVNIVLSPIIKKIGAQIYEDKYSEAYNNYMSVIDIEN